MANNFRRCNYINQNSIECDIWYRSDEHPSLCTSHREIISTDLAAKDINKEAYIERAHKLEKMCFEMTDAELDEHQARIQGKIEELRAAQILDNGDENGDCGAVLPLYRWRQSVTSSTLPGLHEVRVVIERAQTSQEIYELRTLLFVPDDDSTSGKSGNRGDSRSKKRGNRQP